MANRLKMILPHLISLKQEGFIQERCIIDGIIEMHEVLHSTQIENMVTFLLKLDMWKAYDKVNQIFFDKIYEKFIFLTTC